MKYHWATLVILLLNIKYYHAQEDVKKPAFVEMDLDLADGTDGADVIEKKVLQFETAYLNNTFAHGPSASISQNLIRYGLLKKIELRILSEEGYQRDKYITETVQSTYPLVVSAKICLIKNHAFLPNISLIPYLNLPLTAHTSEQAKYWSTMFVLALENKIGKKVKLEYNFGMQQSAYSKDWVWLANLSIHYRLLKKIELFTEYYAQYDTNQLPQHNIDVGVTYQLNNILGCFVVTGSTIYYDPYNRFISGGIAIKLPK